MTEQIINGLVIGVQYSAFAVGLVLIFGVLRVINFAHGAIFAFAGLVAVWSVEHVGGPAIVIALLGGAVAGLIVGGIVHLGIFLPIAKLKVDDHLVPAVATVGFAFLLQAVGQIMFGAEPIAFPSGTLPRSRIDLFGASVSKVSLVACIVALIALVILDRLVWTTKVGRNMRAVAYSPETAELLGINASRVQTVVLIVSAVFAAIAGVATSMSLNLAWPYLSDGILVKGFFIIVLGGPGSVRGAILGGLLLGVVEALSVYWGYGEWRDVVTTGLMFAILMVKPNGLFGEREVLRS